MYILGIALNILEIASLVHARRTKLPFDITLISLAVSDLMLVVVTLLLSIPRLLSNEDRRKWHNYLYVACIYISSLTSASHMCFIAIQRLVAVLYPLKVSIWITRKRSIITVLLLWLASGVVSAPTPMEYYIYIRILLYTPFVSAGVVVVCYFVINLKMMTRKAPTGAGQQSQNISILLYSIAITAIFMICTFPYTIYAIKHVKFPPSYVVHLFFLQVVLNPVVYFFSHILKRDRCKICYKVCQCCGSESVSPD